MKRNIFSFLKVFAGITLLLLSTMVLAVLWPMPQLKPPPRHHSIFIKAINIIDVTSGHLLRNRDIIVRDNVITHIDTAGVLMPDTTFILIDGTNKFLMPGLWDMHTHSTQHSEWVHHPLFIANGITGIRDMSGQLNRRDSYFAGSRERLIWNDELGKNKRVTPRYVLQSSFQIDGAFSVPEGFPEFFKLQKSEDVDSLLRFYKNENVDFIKVYDQIPLNGYEMLATQAPKYGMHVAGHKPRSVSLEDAVSLGQKSFEHGRIFLTECFPQADSLRTAKNWRAFFSKAKASMVNDFNLELAKKLMHQMKAHHAHWTPTLQTLKFEAFAHEPAFLQNPNLKYIPYLSKKLWWDSDVRNNAKRNLSRDGKNISAAFYYAAMGQIKVANEVGVPIMTGTDVSDSYIFPGFSIHTELEDLTKSGLSNLEALQSATIVPVKFVGAEKDYGTIEIGKIADLIILDKNPLDDITYSKTIYGVILNGIYYDSDKLNELKEFTESVSLSFHMNVKILYSLVRSPLMRVQFAD
ncbi:MAG: amidohydrolase family protein [Cytophagales bacterium]|nr:amidohydrolase family protein [Cytophagales bacterium]